MSTHKHIDKICCVVIVLVLIITAVFMNGKSLGLQSSSKVIGYETRLFDTSTVHTIDIIMDDWDGFLDTCTSEEYSQCSIVIDNEAYKNVAIRAKGNTSLTQVASYGNDRYSFKIEFDHYDNTKSYYGLDKLCLNNIIQDNTYMKDYLTYQMMGSFGIASPLCSYVFITVNGEDWGLYLAVEGVEESFLERNYGSDYGELYKPDSQSMGGGRGNGGKFDMDNWQQEGNGEQQQAPFDGQNNKLDFDIGEKSNGNKMQDEMQMPSDNMADRNGGMSEATGSSDVSLIYSDDAYSSYQNIFDNAKTDITDTDKDRLIASLKQLNACENIDTVVDVDTVIRYFVVHNFVCNFDSYTGSMIHNYYLYEKDGQLSMIPWDYNLAFGGFQDVQDATTLVNYPIDTPVSGGTVDTRPMLAWIFSSEEYTELYHQYFSEFITNYFDSGYFAQMIDNVEEMISPYVEKDPTKFCTYEEFQSGISTLKEFCLLRAESISGQLEGTIASTSDGQAQNIDTLIDASDTDISNMGSMNNTGGGMNAPGNMGDFDPSNGTQPQIPEQKAENDGQDNDQTRSEELPSMPPGRIENGNTSENSQDGNAPDIPQNEEGDIRITPDLSDGNIQQDEQMQDKRPIGDAPGDIPSADEKSEDAADTFNTQGTDSWIFIGISAAVLLAGILIAALYKKRA